MLKKALCFAKKWSLSIEELNDLFSYLTDFIFLVCSECGYDYHIAAISSILFRRIYQKVKAREENNNFNDDPRLICVVCIFITAKSKDCNISCINSFLAKIRKKHDPNFKYFEKDVIVSELQCLQILCFDLNIFLPFEVCSDLLMKCGRLDILGFVWKLLLKTFKTDIYLQFPPYLVAMASIYIVACTQSNELNIDFDVFLKRISISFEDIQRCTQQIIKKLFVKKRKESSNTKHHNVPTHILKKIDFYFDQNKQNQAK